MDELHTGPKHPLSDTNPESYFDLHVVPAGYQPKRHGDCGYQAEHSQAYCVKVGLVSLDLLPT